MPTTKVIIPQRNEPLAGWTAKRVLETAPCVDEVIIVNDGQQEMPCAENRRLRIITPWKEPQGTAPARDAGIIAAGADCDYVILLDAHMNFPNGFDWAERLVARCVAHNDQAIVSPGSCILNHQTKQMQVKDTEKGMAFGTTISMKSGGVVKDNKRSPRMVFESKWRPKYESLPGETQSVLGACYCFSREWYIQDLHRPWQGMEGWGTLEQSLTIPNWLAGGICYVEPFVIGHLYRKSGQVPYRQHMAQLWYNKFRLVEVLPMADKTRNQLRAHLMKNGACMQHFDAIKSAMESNATHNDALREHLAGYEVTIEDYFDAWKDGSPGKMVVADIRAALADRNVTHAKSARKPALVKLLLDTLSDEMRGNRPAFGIDYPGEEKGKAGSGNQKPETKPKGTRPYVKNPEVHFAGIQCPHCKGQMFPSESKRTHTYPNGNRRFICPNCAMPFVVVKAKLGESV